MALHLTPRDSGAITVVDASGRITLGDAAPTCAKPFVSLSKKRIAKIVLNLADVDYIDSSGIGELVSAYTAVRSKGGELKLLHLTKKVHDLLQITKLFTVFEVYSDERLGRPEFPLMSPSSSLLDSRRDLCQHTPALVSIKVRCRTLSCFRGLLVARVRPSTTLNPRQRSTEVEQRARCCEMV